MMAEESILSGTCTIHWTMVAAMTPRPVRGPSHFCKGVRQLVIQIPDSLLNPKVYRGTSSS